MDKQLAKHDLLNTYIGYLMLSDIDNGKPSMWEVIGLSAAACVLAVPSRRLNFVDNSHNGYMRTWTFLNEVIIISCS